MIFTHSWTYFHKLNFPPSFNVLLTLMGTLTSAPLLSNISATFSPSLILADMWRAVSWFCKRKQRYNINDLVKRVNFYILDMLDEDMQIFLQKCKFLHSGWTFVSLFRGAHLLFFSSNWTRLLNVSCCCEGVTMQSSIEIQKEVKSKVPCTRTQHTGPHRIQTHDPGIKSP